MVIFINFCFWFFGERRPQFFIKQVWVKCMRQNMTSIYRSIINKNSNYQNPMQNIDIRNSYSYSHSPTRSHPSKIQQLSTTYFEHHRINPISFKNTIRKHYQYNHACNREQQNVNKNFTFRPEIHEIPGHIYGGSRSKIQKSREQMREKLIQDTTKIIQDRFKQKIKKEEEEIKACTFQPRVSQFLVTQPASGEIFDRLFRQAEQIRENKLQTQRMRKQQESEQINRLIHHKLYLEKPTILNTQKHNISPLHTRLAQILQSRLKLQKDLRQQYNKQKNMTFAPEISEQSQKIACQKIERQKLKENVIERLMQQYQKLKKRKEKDVETWKKKQEQECTFNPEINSYVGGDSRRREAYWMGRQASRLEEEEYLYPFKPKIDKLSNLIVMHARGEQDQDVKIDRLTRKPLQEKAINVSRLREQIYSQFTFKPQINQISAEILPLPRSHRCQHPVPQTYSFQPRINQKSKLIRPQSAQISKIKIKKRQLQYKLESQYEEMKECSFQPRINNKRHQGDRSLDRVEGVDKFMESRQKAKRKVEEQKERQTKVFGYALKYDQRMNFPNKL